MSENRDIKEASELYCYKMTLRCDADNRIDELFVVAPSLTDACAYVYEYCTEIVKTEYCGVGAVWSRMEDSER